jgi:hypothetical protein
VGYWLDQLWRAITFYEAQKTTAAASDLQPDKPRRAENETARADPLANIDWTNYRFVSTSEIDGFLGRVLTDARALDAFVSFANSVG